MNKLVTIVLTLIIGLLAGFLYFRFDSRREIKLAERYIKEYRFAKALDLLNESKKRNKKVNVELQQLLFYAAIKAKNFNTANVIIDDIQSFEVSFKKKFYEIVKVLYKKEQDELLQKLLARSSKIKLEQDYLISLSKKQKNLEKEMQVLLMGRKLFLDIKEDLLQKKKIKEAEAIKIDKLEKYILDRYMNQANLFIAHQNYKSALEQMKKAQELSILEEVISANDNGQVLARKTEVEYKKEKADYKYLLGTIYKFLGNKEKAWNLIRESAALDNLQAKDSLEQAKRKYRKR